MRSKTMILLVMFVVFISFFALSEDVDADSDEVVFDGVLYRDLYDSSRYSASIYLEPGLYKVSVNDYYVTAYYTSGASVQISPGESGYVVFDYSSEFYLLCEASPSSISCMITKTNDYVVTSSDYSGWGFCTKLDVKCGTFSIVGLSMFSLVMGDTEVTVSDYVPFDYSGAYIYSYYTTDRLIEPSKITNVPVDYDGTLHFNEDASYSDYMYIPSGEYTLRFSMGGSLSPLSGYEYFNFNAGEEKTYIFNGGYYRYSIYLGSHNEMSINYDISPEVHEVPLDDTMELEECTVGTQYMWYRKVIHLSAGTHEVWCNNNGDWTYFLESDGEKESMFLSTVIGSYRTSIPEEYRPSMYHISLDRSMDVTFYFLSRDVDDGRYKFNIDDTLYYEWGESMYSVHSESVYVSANSSVKIGAKYDSSKYVLYLIDGEDMIALPAGALIEIITDISKEYTIAAYANISDSKDAFSCQYEVYMEGIPEPDDNAPLFAALCIGLCVVFFGLLLYSGRKPKWKD